MLLLTLASCGGGKGGTPALGEPVPITASNAQAIASAVWLGHTVSTADEVVPDHVLDVLDDYIPLLACRPNTLPLEIACGISGSVVVEGALANVAQPGMQVGDRATAAYRSCLQTHSSLIPDLADGTMTVEVTASTAEARTLSVRFDALRVGISEALMFTQEGEASVTLSLDRSAASLSTNLLVASGAGAVLILKEYLLDFAKADVGHLLSFRGTQSGGEFEGSLAFETTTPFHLPGSGYPEAGELVITGAAGSSVTLQAQPDGNHVVLVVNGGDPVETTWVALEE